MLPRGGLIKTSDGDIRILSDVPSGTALDGADESGNAVQTALLLDSYVLLLADSPLTTSDGSPALKPARAYWRFYNQLRKGSIVDTIKRYSTLAYSIVESTMLTGRDTYTGEFVSGMKDTPIFKEYLAWYRTGDPLLLQYILSFLWFAKKADYWDPDLDTVAFRAWLGVEEKLSDLELPTQRSNELREILRWLTDNFSFTSTLEPIFGPGAVAEDGVRGEIAKSNAIRFDPRLDRLLFRSFSGLAWRGDEEDGFHPEKVLPDPTVWNKTSERSSKTSKLLFVPKDITKSRSICMEPNSYMMAQQMVRCDVNVMFRSGLMSRFVTLEDQSRNRELAAYGSLTGEVDTIDLSSASDSVHSSLVDLFPRKLAYALKATRTSLVQLPNGEQTRVNKFAPMGSALCFPTQCMIFVGLSLLAHILVAQGTDPLDLDTPVQDKWLVDRGRRSLRLLSREAGYHYHPGRIRFNPLTVYGDDIVIDTRVTRHLLHLLNAFGFSVNTEKSFTGGQAFRESCGGFYWGGHDVTPLRYSVKRVTDGNPARHVASMIAMANAAGDRGLRHVRSYLIHRAQEVTHNNIAFTHDRKQTSRIFTERPQINLHLKHREQPKSEDPAVPWYDREEIRCIVFLPDQTVDPLPHQEEAHQRYLYRKWWRGRTGDEALPVEETHGVLPFDMRGVKLGRRWTPAS